MGVGPVLSMLGVLPVSDKRVRPSVEPLTEADYRHKLAAGMLQPVHEQGPTRVGLKIGANEKTVRGARDKRSTLRGDNAWNLLLVDGHALDHLAAHFGKKLVDAGAVCFADNASLPCARLVARVAEAECPDGDAGAKVTDEEIIQMLPEIRAVAGILEGWMRRADERRLKAVGK